MVGGLAMDVRGVGIWRRTNLHGYDWGDSAQEPGPDS
jgi:hypothetical protein